MNGFLPISKKDMKERGWDQVDFAYVIADAYVDHSSFGPAIISRVLEAHGFRVGIIAQPDWTNPDSIDVFGRPRLGFLISGGNMDPMVNHYTVSKKHRSTDAYSPGGKMGCRPDHATIVYGNLIRAHYKDVPIVIGGIEASLRRLAHYDYWSDSLKRSILLDSQADLISYGMGEHSIVEIAEALDSGLAIEDITFIRGTVYKTKDLSSVYDYTLLPSYNAMKADKLKYAESFGIQNENTDPFAGTRLVEPYERGNSEKIEFYVVQNTAALPLTRQELDDVYALPYQNTYHPIYEKEGGIPAISEIKFSLTSNRGCFGGCSFCALTFHQGRIIQSRSKESLVAEATAMIKDPDFKGYIHDVGGPTANFHHPACAKQLTKGVCKNRQCLFPTPCPNLNVDHSEYVETLRALRKLPGVKKVFVRSGVRFDYALLDRDDTFIKELCEFHISGQLRVAPEHVSDHVLALMGKPPVEIYEKFVAKCERINNGLGKEQYLVPYLMSSHPGSTLEDAITLAEHIRDIGYMPEQVQDFYPTPSTISTVMYYTGVDPRNMKPIYVTRNPHEKAMQRALIQYRDPKNYDLVKEALLLAGREDLIGFGKECLIPPRRIIYKGGKPVNNAKKPAGKTENPADKAKKPAGKTGNPESKVTGRPVDKNKAMRSKEKTVKPGDKAGKPATGNVKPKAPAHRGNKSDRPGGHK